MSVSVGRVPNRGVDAVGDARQHVGAGREQAAHAHAAGGRADLGGVGGRDGGDPVGQSQPGLQHADGAVILHAVDRVGGGGRPSVASSVAGIWPWNARLWMVMTVAGAAADGPS